MPEQSELITRILFGAPDGMRFTQDSPMLRDVWIKFADVGGKGVDVLIVPWESCTAIDVADYLHEALQVFRERAKPKEREAAHIADVPGVIAAKLYFDEIWNLVFPQTRWWSDWQLAPFLALPVSAQVKAVKAWAAALRSIGGGGRPLDLGDEYQPAWPKASGPDEVDQHPVAIEDPACRTIVLSGLIEADAVPDRLGEIDPEKAGRGWRSIVAPFRAEEQRPDAMIFSISRNREAVENVADSVPTTKADAARELFSIDCSKIGWAIIDSGIDRDHKAFRPSDDAAKKPAPRRIVETYDLTRFRDIRSRDILLSDGRRNALADQIADREGEQQELPPARARALLDSMRDDLKARRPVDYGKIEELLRRQRYTAPDNPHGTHVAGILGAKAWAGSREKVSGMCPDIRLYDFRVLSATMQETEFAVIGALRLIDHINRSSNFMRIHGANLSLALPHDVMNYACGRTPVCLECEALVHSGVVVVAAAGNQGFQEFITRRGEIPLHVGTSITDPGNAELVITVGSTHRIEPHNYGVSYFSSRGPTADGRPKPDIVAPGEKITAPVPGGNGTRTARKGGTSMAAPHVSGAAAMLMARFPELRGRPDRIKAILCKSATDLGRERAYQGAGLLDVLRALQSV